MTVGMKFPFLIYILEKTKKASQQQIVTVACETFHCFCQSEQSQKPLILWHSRFSSLLESTIYILNCLKLILKVLINENIEQTF